MSTQNNRIVYQQDDGQWLNQRGDDRSGATSHSTQADAIAAAKRMLQKDGGGELTVKGQDGKIRSKDTIAPGNDPNPPKDHEH
jgi:hypothetical protein